MTTPEASPPVEHPEILVDDMAHVDIVPFFQPGESISARYLDPKPIKGTNFSTNFKAFDAVSGQYVAVKFFRESDDNLSQLATHEVDLHASLSDKPGFLPLLDKGHIERSDQDFKYMVTPFCHNGTLPQAEAKTSEEVRRRVALVSDMVAAAGVLHKMGLVHCDVKPGNMFISPYGTGWLGDFGLVEMPMRKNAVPGTLGYMPYETLGLGIIHPKSDTYGFGAALYETVTGKVPHIDNETMLNSTKPLSSQGNSGELLARDSKTKPTLLDSMELDDLIPPNQMNRRAVTNELSRVIMTTLALKPEDRYEDGDLYERLDAIARPRLSVAV